VPVNILIVDDSASLRRLLRSRIDENPEWKVCGEAENGQIAVEKIKALNPNVVILDWLMPVMSGLEAARQITRFSPNTAMLMLTLHSSKQLLEEANAVGIQRVFSKTESLADLITSVRNVVAALGI
jgi:two-component system, NarL family, invasion response regulator UvrY